MSDVVVIVTSIFPVADFERWKEALDTAFATGPPARGMLGYRVFRAPEDRNEVLLELELDTVANAESMLAMADEQWLNRSGLEIYPPAFVGEPIASGRFETSAT